MNENKICFIICVNNDEMFQECQLYIERLLVPEGMEIDLLTVYEARSMTSGYNEAMNASDAKYKIYMHQDVFIIDQYWLCELVEIFKRDNKIGMLGVVGTKQMPSSGCMWDSNRVGCIYSEDLHNIDKCGTCLDISSDQLVAVEAIDGLLMATQYDIPWREDIFSHFDFYDASQSFEFRKHGFKVMVPVIDKPVCVHDDGVVLNYRYYDHERKLFLNEYKTMIN